MSDARGMLKSLQGREADALFFSVVFSSLMCFSFTTMFAQTYEIPFSYLLFVPAILAYSVVVSYFLFRNLGRRALLFVLISVVVTASVATAEYFKVFDILHLRNSVQFLLCKLREFTFHDLELSFAVSASGELSVAVLFFLIGMIPTALTCWVIMRKKNVLFSIVAFLPYFALTIALNYSFPSQWSCQIALGCVVVLILFQNMRKHVDVKAYSTIFKMLGAVMAIVFVIGILSPQSRYDKDKLAQKEVQLATSVYRRASRIISDIPGTLDHLVEKFKGNIPDGFKFEPIEDTGTEHLYLAGMVDVEEVHLMDVTRTKNPAYSGETYDDRYLYLKTWSKGKYTGQTWESDVDDMRYDELFLPGMQDRAENCQYFLYLDIFRRVYRLPVPYYADFYIGNPSETLLNRYSIAEMQTSLFNEKTDNFSAGSNTQELYAANNTPIYVGGRVRENYERLVQAEYLQVPTSTRDKIIQTGLLPDWFMQAMYGNIVMSDREKVARVEEFVRSLHPYDENTRTMPRDEDFVVWFMKDSSTGFCVHYASTAAILLRMLGVPTRYVDGYMLNTIGTGSAPVPVYSTDAHAWIEVYDSSYGWILCDPTPGNENAERGFSFEAIYGEGNFTDPPHVNPVNPDTGETDPTAETSSEMTTMPTPGEFSYNTPTPVPKPDEEGTGFSFEFGFVHWIVLAVLGVFLLILLVRWVYILSWRSKLKSRSKNDSARAYYRYFLMMLSNYGKRPSHRITALAQRAAFSQEGLTNEQYSSLVKTGKELIQRAEKDGSFRRKFIGKHILGIPSRFL